MASTTSWTPRPADVLRYAYLWSHEADRGQEEGVKDRPAVVVLTTTRRDDSLSVLVAPITTRAPATEADGIAVPPRVKAHLGLDAPQCWIMLTEMNQFIWPGPDIRPVDHDDETSLTHGQIPELLYERVRLGILDHYRRKRLRQVNRTS